jgi:hypothetical protein
VKSNRKCLGRCLALGGALMVILGFSGQGLAQQPKAVGEIIALTGSAELKPAQEAQFKAAQIKARLFPKDQVRTHVKSKAKLWFVDESLLILGENTLLNVAEYNVDSTGRRLNAFLKMVTGKMRFIVHKYQTPEANFQVEGTTAVLGIRGTDGVMQMSSPDTVYLLEGKKDLAVKNKSTGEKILLPPMHFVTALMGKPLKIGKITPQMYRSLMTEFQVGGLPPPQNLTSPPKAPDGRNAAATLGNPSIVQDTNRNVLPFTHIDQPPLPTVHQGRPSPSHSPSGTP